MDANAFAEEAIRAFSKCRPNWQAPHDTIFAVAEKHRLTATVNGITRERWQEMKKTDQGGDADERLEVVLASGPTVIGTIHLKWVDLQVLEELTPRRQVRKR